MCQWMKNSLVPSSHNIKLKIWEDHKTRPLAVIRSYDGHPVFSATFYTAFHWPVHIVLITGVWQHQGLKRTNLAELQLIMYIRDADFENNDIGVIKGRLELEVSYNGRWGNAI
ncbi:hypothetical protein PIB30_010201 [Stylosanthes scabra]|uniref:Uncharacterized protein n=1 Tax=Stylosanthes scabra TaxID=79078 RepID=A0ABU6R603_9FABA|nr:hypothetical protein [Stylosanthes scabra]